MKRLFLGFLDLFDFAFGNEAAIEARHYEEPLNGRIPTEEELTYIL